MPALAVVGSRHPSAGGIRNAHEFAKHLVGYGLTIVSGLAVGIDAAAHEGALQGGGLTIAVCGTGLDRVYPSVNTKLAQRIAREGALISEFPVGTKPLSQNFPRRNRIISGLSMGLLVVEAAPQSGSLISARMAMEQGREVFAIPGSIHNPLARGCHALIRQGAKLVETAADILEELAPQISINTAIPKSALTMQETVAEISDEQSHLLDIMGYEAISVDDMVERSGLTAEEVSSMLLLLELQGLIEASPGGLYNRVMRGYG
jgi:DNA processing protein